MHDFVLDDRPAVTASFPSHPSRLRPRKFTATDFQLRPAQPEDAPFVLPLVYSSGVAEFDYVMTVDGLEALDFLKFAFAEGSGQFGWRNHFVGLVEGEIVAAAAGWTIGSVLPFNLAVARQFIRFYGLARAIGVAIRGLRAEWVMPPPFREEFYIAHVGVRPDLRGCGLGTLLIETLTETGRSVGARVVGLDVSAANPRAEALYRRLGFDIRSERQAAWTQGRGRLDPHRRLCKRL